MTILRESSEPAFDLDAQTGAELDMNKVLVVDDTPLNLEYLQAIFALETEFSLTVANSGQEGLEKARDESPFLILSDIQMPGMDGIRLCKEIRSDQRTKNAALIMITAYGKNTGLVSKCLNLGADDFIAQPFEKDELLARVRAVARLKRAELEAQRQTHLAAQRNQGLELLNELAVAITSSLSLDMIFDTAMQQLAHLLTAEAVSILLLDKEMQNLTVNITASIGSSVSTVTPLTYFPDLTPLNLQKQAAQIITDTLSNTTLDQEIPFPNSQDDLVCLPMISKEGIIGTIVIICRQDVTLTAADWSLLNSAVGIITVAVENARLFEQAKSFNRRLEQMVQARTSELNQEKKKVEAILASMADGVLVLDDKDQILTTNSAAEAIFGADAAQLQSLSLNSPNLNSPLWSAIRRLVNETEPNAWLSVDVPAPTQPGDIYSFHLNAAAVQNEANRTIGTVIVLNDVTAIVEVERMKARFMAGVTHELKTPLAIIKLNTNNLASYHARLPEEKRNEMLKATQGQIVLLEQLIEDILELARFDSSLQKIERESMDLVALVKTVVAESMPLATAKGLSLNCQTDLPELLIQADPNKLTWLIGNLVDNAIKYTLSGSIDVTLEANTSAGEMTAVVRVADTGIGIPPEEQASVFERFYRVDTSHTIPGTGLGLSIVKEIADAHGGQVMVESDPTQGSIFTVMLPQN